MGNGLERSTSMQSCQKSGVSAGKLSHETTHQLLGEEQCELAEILRHKAKRGKMAYQVRKKDGTKVWIQEGDLHRQDLLENFQPNERKRYPMRQRTNILALTVPGNMWQIALVTVLFLVAGLSGARETKQRAAQSKIEANLPVDLGALYQCSVSKNEGLFGFNEVSSCKDNRGNKPLMFPAEVLEHKIVEKPMRIHMCRSTISHKLCQQKFFGSDKERLVVEEIPNADQCRKAINDKVSPHGYPITEVNNARMETKFEKKYDCEWMQTTDSRYHT